MRLSRIAFSTNENGERIEERALSHFDMPRGYEDKECRLKFIYNGGNAYPAGEYSVWALEGDGADAARETTWHTKPEATEKLATFITGDKMLHLNPNDSGSFSKMDASFLENPTFPCPGPGRFAYETRGNDPEALDVTTNPGKNPLNVAGGDGLAIEIIGAPSGYNKDADHDNDDADDGNDDGSPIAPRPESPPLVQPASSPSPAATTTRTVSPQRLRAAPAVPRPSLAVPS